VHIKHLEYLVALSREQHFARAAAVCGVTQPTLSEGIKQLEQSLGALIVARGHRFHGFTPDGERVLMWARRIIADVDALQQELSERRGNLAGPLRLGVVPAALPMVGLLTLPFAQRFPRATISVMSLTSIDIDSQLEDFALDAGITYLDNEPLSRVNTVPLYKESFCLLTAADAPLGGRERVSWAELAQLPLCLLTEDLQTRRIIDGLLKRGEDQPPPPLEADSTILLLAQVRTGHWATIVSAKNAETLAPTETIRAVPIVEPAAVHTIGLVVPAREPMTALTAALVAEARRNAATPGASGI
jgi:DNA-binding transcriptional LysR family regulator